MAISQNIDLHSECDADEEDAEYNHSRNNGDI
jgi:hypothetical protein